MTRVLGIDIGGSASRARLVVDGQVVAEAQAGSASLTAVGPEAAEQALAALLGRLPGAGAGSLDAICAGAAGLTAPDTSRFLRARLEPLTRSGVVVITDDAALVLPAAGIDDGISVICGTGSIATGQWQGHRLRAGGWGYLLGDEGGGYWIVREAVRILLSRRDRDAPAGALADRLLTASELADTGSLHAAFLGRPQPRYWARYAPAVLDCDDPAAADLAEAAAGALARLVSVVATRLAVQHAAPRGLPVVLAGGLMAHDRLWRAAAGAVTRAVPGSAVTRLAEPPVAGAVRLAVRAAAAG